MSVHVSRHSRWIFGELLDDPEDGVQFFDMLTLPPIERQIDDVDHVVRGVDRLDTLARLYYGDDSLQWVIAHANDIELWPTGLRVGATLRIPSARYITQVWLARARPRTRGA